VQLEGRPGKEESVREALLELGVISLPPEQFILDVIAPERIVVVNLDRRPDRWEAMLEAWTWEISRRFTRFSATDGQSAMPDAVRDYCAEHGLQLERCGGDFGARDSWIRAVEHYGPGLYFEDDAHPSQSWAYGLPPNDAEVVLIGGGLTVKVAEPGWGHIHHKVWGTHAFWLRTQRAADALVHAWRHPEGPCQPVDDAWNQTLKAVNAVVAVPQMVVQFDLRSDIQPDRRLGPHDTSLFQPWCSLQGRPPR
jgi:hypothetical protein